MDVHFIDTTFRDGSQSLWASGMRTGMMEAVAEIMDEVGFAAIEVPLNGIYFKKFVRDLKEDPWDLLRMLGRKMPKTVKGCMARRVHSPVRAAPAARTDRAFLYERLVATGAFNRAQLTSNTVDQIKRTFPWIIPIFRGLGVQIVLALSYTISPRHTDDYYAQKTRELLAFKPDAIYVKDQGGLLTVDRVRTLLPAMIQNAAGVPIELHSHCTTGLAPLVYLEALRLGVRTLHTAVPPLAQGSSQPSVLNVVRNARLMGFSARVNEGLIEEVARAADRDRETGKAADRSPARIRFRSVHSSGSRRRHLEPQVPTRRNAHAGPAGRSARRIGPGPQGPRLSDHDHSAVAVRGHPGGHQCRDRRTIQACHRRADPVRPRRLRGRFRLYRDGPEFEGQTIEHATSGRARRAAEGRTSRSRDLRASLGGTAVSDEEFLLRYIMKGDQEIRAMRAAGPPKQYFNTPIPMLTLLDELGKQKASATSACSGATTRSLCRIRSDCVHFRRSAGHGDATGGDAGRTLIFVKDARQPYLEMITRKNCTSL